MFHVGILKSNNFLFLNQTDKHSPKKAAIKSAILPGLGQNYNKKNWKIPIIYAGIGVSSYFIYYNNKNFSEVQTELLVRAGKSSKPKNSKFTNTNDEILKLDRNFYRTNREYSIIALAAVYVLNIIDASVDAHFHNMNLDKSLTKKNKNNNRFWTLNSNQNNISLQFNF